MKVLFATYPMAFHTPGGGEIQLQAYQKHLPAHGVEVDLFNPWQPNFLNYDLVHFFSCVGGSIHFCNFVKQLGLPLVISSSLWVTNDTKHLYPIDEIRGQLSLADVVITNSELESETLAHVLDLPKEKFQHVYNGVDEIFLDKIPESLFRSQFNMQDKFILNVGNIEPRKNQLALVKAMKRFPEMKLVLIGHKRDEMYAQECFNEGGEQVVYLGPLPHDSPLLRSAYSACEVFCLPSTLETPGLAALEAFVSGAKVAVTSEGSTMEYFLNKVDYLTPYDINSIEASVSNASGKKGLVNSQPDEIGLEYLWGNVTKPLASIYSKLSVMRD